MNISTNHRDKTLRHFSRTLVLIFGFVLIWHTTDGQCRETTPKGAKVPAFLPIDIESDTMEARQENSMVEFSGNVIATQDGLEIRADSIKFFFDSPGSWQKPEAEDPAPRIKKIVSEGHVHCLTGQRQAMADKAVYTTYDQALVLTGKKVTLMEGNNQVTGEKLTLFIQQNRAIMESKTRGRVRASFSPAGASLPGNTNGS